MRTDYVAQALDIKYRTEREKSELTKEKLALQKEVETVKKELVPTQNFALSTLELYTAEGNTAPADAGIVTDSAPAFEYGHAYKKGDLFNYEGNMGFVKQDHTSQSTWVPFTTGTESLYGARPKPVNGVYPYTYNMAVELDMRVSENGQVYVCYANPTETLIWPPSQVPAIFKKEGE